MRLFNLFKIAYISLNKNKMRSLLTMLGIIIGVASVITMLAVGQGSSDSIQSSIATLGSNVIMVIPGTASQGGVRTEAGASQNLQEEDAQAIKDECPSVKYVSPVIRKSSQLISASANWRTSINGVYNDYLLSRNQDVVKGLGFSEADNRRAAKVCVIGQTVAHNLFGEDIDPVGQRIRIDKIPFKIIGVLEVKGQSMMGQDQDDVVYVPFSTIQKRMVESKFIQMIMISAKSEDVVQKAKSEITDMLRIRLKVPEEEAAPFDIRTQEEISKMFTSISAILMLLLASIATISLIVGGIGIMNIMLVSVTERTKEIGLRMALGARQIDILLQFLTEAIMLSILGGIIGMLLGVSVSLLLSKVTGWEITISSSSIIISFVFSSLTGIFFGWYPSRKASIMTPIEALRYE